MFKPTAIAKTAIAYRTIMELRYGNIVVYLRARHQKALSINSQVNQIGQRDRLWNKVLNISFGFEKCKNSDLREDNTVLIFHFLFWKMFWFSAGLSGWSQQCINCVWPIPFELNSAHQAHFIIKNYKIAIYSCSRIVRLLFVHFSLAKSVLNLYYRFVGTWMCL